MVSMRLCAPATSQPQQADRGDGEGGRFGDKSDGRAVSENIGAGRRVGHRQIKRGIGNRNLSQVNEVYVVRTVIERHGTERSGVGTGSRNLAHRDVRETVTARVIRIAQVPLRPVPPRDVHLVDAAGQPRE